MPGSFLTSFKEGVPSTPATRVTSLVPETHALSDRFLLAFSRRQFGKQFASLYHHRLTTLRPRIKALADAKWAATYEHMEKVLDINDQQPYYVIGTVFCDLKYKPNILHDVASGTYNAPPIPKDTYIKSDDRSTDRILLEDESGRVVLFSKDPEFFTRHSVLVTGCVAGILGKEIEAGVFEVMDIIHPPLGAQSEPKRKEAPLPLGKVAFVSGLAFAEDSTNDLRLEVLKDVLLGELGDPALAASISRLVVVGDSIDNSQQNSNRFAVDDLTFGATQLSNYNALALEKLDEWLSDLLSSIPVLLMPGSQDPVDSIYPQQPWHRSLLPKCAPFHTTEGQAYFSLPSNPSWHEVDGLRLLGTSGENISDFFKYVQPFDLKDTEPGLRLALMEQNLKWAHLAPTCPDTLWCYPYDGEDPFIMNELPHVYFVGNQPQGDSKMVSIDGKKVQLVTVPRFRETGEIVVMDLETLAVQVVKIL